MPFHNQGSIAARVGIWNQATNIELIEHNKKNRKVPIFFSISTRHQYHPVPRIEPA